MHYGLERATPFAPDELFGLVADVERYPEFVPWVTRLEVLRRRTAPDGTVLLDAQADVGFSFVRERFATRVRLDPGALVIDVDLISGPFRKLECRWRFAPLGDQSELHFDIDFEFRSRLLDRVFAANFPRAAARLVACFEDRARALFGTV